MTTSDPFVVIVGDPVLATHPEVEVPSSLNRALLSAIDGSLGNGNTPPDLLKKPDLIAESLQGNDGESFLFHLR